jgi:rieske iron-sulfur protein
MDETWRGSDQERTCSARASMRIGAAAGRLPRRVLLQSLVSAGLVLPLGGRAQAQDDQPGSEERPMPGDLLVFSEGDREGQVVAPADLPRDAEPILVWPMDPQSKVVRDGSRLNQVLLLNLDPNELNKEMLDYAADGIVAFSAICTHAGCPVTGWVESEAVGRRVLKCFCHNSEYDPRQAAAVVFGPAPRHLAVLPVRIAAGTLTVAKNFIGKVGPTQSM